MSYLRKSVSGEEDKSVTLSAGTAEIGKLAAGTAAIGKLAAGTAAIGKLAAGTAAIGSVTIGAGTASIGSLTPRDVWNVHATGSGSSTVTATKSAVGSDSHYICGLTASVDVGAEDAESVKVSLTQGTAGMGDSIIYQFSFLAVSTKVNFAGGGPVVITFDSPFFIAASVNVNLKVDPSGSNSDLTDANLWGFTA